MPGFFATITPARLREFLDAELCALQPDLAAFHAQVELKEMIDASVGNIVESFGEGKPISEARFLRLMVRIKCAMGCKYKPEWRLASGVHCPLCALKVLSYVL